eukprot:2684075-Prymnesium_polylepis.1
MQFVLSKVRLSSARIEHMDPLPLSEHSASPTCSVLLGSLLAFRAASAASAFAISPAKKVPRGLLFARPW